MRIGKMGSSWRLLLVLVSLLAFTTAGAARAPDAPGEILFILDERDSGSEVELREGQVLAVSLEGNPSTGYLWQVAHMDEGVVREIGEIQFEPKSGLLGAPATMTRRFEAVGAGQGDLVLVYRRPWEDGEPTATFSVQVRAVGTFTTSSSASVELAPVPASEPAAEEVTAKAERLAQTLPSSFNWCDLGGCTPVKDQGNCGSCWAFGTVGPFESQIKLQDGVTRDLAEQYLLSCNTDGYGCDGGWWAHDYHEWKVPPGEPDAGAVYESDFAYVAQKVPCSPPHTHHEKISSWSYVGPQDDAPPVADIKQAIYDHGPVAVAVCVNSAFQGYNSGVFLGPSCGDINHAVVLVGWDDSLGGGGAWRLRNSWGPGWGEDGYMWIKYRVSYVGYSANYVVYEAAQPPAAPSSLLAAPASQTRINLSWSDNSTNETGFRIERSPTGQSSWEQVDTVGADLTTYADGSLASDTTYYYRVRAYNGSGDSGYSNVASTTTFGPFTSSVYVPLLLSSAGAAGGVANGDFEAGHTAWTEYSSNGRTLILNSGFPTGVTPRGGTWAVWLGGQNSETGHIEQQVTIAPSRPYLHYWHWIKSNDLCNYDFAQVRVNGSPVDAYTLCVAGNTGGWQAHAVNLGAYAGQSVSLQLRIVNDGSLVSNLFIDDVSLQAGALSGPGAQTP